MKAVVLAAGKGTRLGALTASCPKPMLFVAGRPVIARLLEMLAKILVGRMRGAIDRQINAAAGAHIVTAPPAIPDKALDHKYSRGHRPGLHRRRRQHRGRD